MDLDLGKIRLEINGIDEQLAKLFEQRMHLVSQVAEYKIQTGKAVFDPERERQNLERVGQYVESEEDRQGMREILAHIMSISRKREYRQLVENGKAEPTGFTMVRELPLEGKRVAYAGVEGGFGYEAAVRFCGGEGERFAVPNHRAVLQAVDEGRADYGVLPIENSSAGAVTDVYDSLLSYNVCLVAQMTLPVVHCLLGVPGAQLSDIRQVHSHPQALMQCGPYLGGHPQWEQVPENNTAASAKMVAEWGDRSQAAVASQAAASLYGLQVLAPSIQQSTDNTTRFVIVTREHLYREDASKLCLCLECRHETGSLYQMLSHFAYNGLNLTQIESRPIPGRNWEYRFFLDAEGNLKDPGVQNALKGLQAEAALCRILGNC